MAGTVVVTFTGVGDTTKFGALAGARLQGLDPVRELLNGTENGASDRGVAVYVNTSTVTGAFATGTLTISSGSGSVGGTIGGTAVTATWATSDTVSAALVAAAINANTTVNKFCSATSAAGVVTITAASVGQIGERITLVASGTGVTASGANLGAGAGVDGVGGVGAPIRYV
jgi:phage tail sheath gpL-like